MASASQTDLAAVVADLAKQVDLIVEQLKVIVEVGVDAEMEEEGIADNSAAAAKRPCRRSARLAGR